MHNMRQVIRRMLFQTAHQEMSVAYSGKKGLAIPRRVRRAIARKQAHEAFKAGPQEKPDDS